MLFPILTVIKNNNYFYKMRKENLNKLAEDTSNPSSLKDMWNKIQNLKLYKQIKP